MRHLMLPLCLSLVGGAALAVWPAGNGQGAGDGNHVFLIPQADGYGVADCIAGQQECGRIVANAWCESKGFTRAASFGLASASDVTGSVGSRSQRQPEPPLMIYCEK